MDHLNGRAEPYTPHVDRIEAVLAQKDAEIRRLQCELEMRNLYVQELLSAIITQSADLSSLDERLRRLEPRSDSGAEPRPVFPVLMRLRKLL